jgi:uncharacterized protein (TIGR04255 family)
MSEQNNALKNPPIVEAVLDIDCDMPPDFSVEARIPDAQRVFGEQYPKMQKRYVHQHEIKQELGGIAEVASKNAELQAILLRAQGEKQLVQVRNRGFSFNRLAPYSRLDDYLPEIERTWNVFVAEFKPLQVRKVSLRYINRLLLPLNADGGLNTDDFLKVGPKLPDDERLAFSDFLNQHHVVEKDTGNQAKIILASQPPEKGCLPIIFDIEATNPLVFEPEWGQIRNLINSLRDLKNHIFQHTLTGECIALFNQV